MRATSALQAALEQGGYDIGIARDEKATSEDIRAYFTAENFRSMFGAGEDENCGGFTFEDCADAMIEELGT